MAQHRRAYHPTVDDRVLYPEEAEKIQRALGHVIEAVRQARDLEHDPIAKGMLSGVLGLGRAVSIGIARIAHDEERRDES
jgi:hypothetical protein